MVSKSLCVCPGHCSLHQTGKVGILRGQFRCLQVPRFHMPGPFVWMQWSYIGWQEKDPIGCWRCERCGVAQVMENFQDNMLLIHSALWTRLKLVFVFFQEMSTQDGWKRKRWKLKETSRLQTAHQVLKVRGHEGNIDTTETTSPGWKFFRASRNCRDFCVEKLFICYSFSPWRMS